MKLFEDTLEMNKPYYLDHTGNTIGILEKRDEDSIYFYPLVNDSYRVESDGYIKLAKINYVYNRTTEAPQAEVVLTPTQIEIGMKYQCKGQPELGYVIPKIVDEEQDDIRFENYTDINYIIIGGLVTFSLKLFSEYFELRD
jgi:hypothetical protein